MPVGLHCGFTNSRFGRVYQACVNAGWAELYNNNVQVGSIFGDSDWHKYELLCIFDNHSTRCKAHVYVVYAVYIQVEIITPTGDYFE